MTGVGQTQLGASISRAELLSPKGKIRTGCWNVRTMHQTGKLAQIVEMDRYRMDTMNRIRNDEGKIPAHGNMPDNLNQ